MSLPLPFFKSNLKFLEIKWIHSFEKYKKNLQFGILYRSLNDGLVPYTYQVRPKFSNYYEKN